MIEELRASGASHSGIFTSSAPKSKEDEPGAGFSRAASGTSKLVSDTFFSGSLCVALATSSCFCAHRLDARSPRPFVRRLRLWFFRAFQFSTRSCLGQKFDRVESSGSWNVLFMSSWGFGFRWLVCGDGRRWLRGTGRCSGTVFVPFEGSRLLRWVRAVPRFCFCYLFFYQLVVVGTGAAGLTALERFAAVPLDGNRMPQNPGDAGNSTRHTRWHSGSSWISLPDKQLLFRGSVGQKSSCQGTLGRKANHRAIQKTQHRLGVFGKRLALIAACHGACSVHCYRNFRRSRLRFCSRWRR